VYIYFELLLPVVYGELCVLALGFDLLYFRQRNLTRPGWGFRTSIGDDLEITRLVSCLLDYLGNYAFQQFLGGGRHHCILQLLLRTRMIHDVVVGLMYYISSSLDAY
jgi:hypothetical protein